MKKSIKKIVACTLALAMVAGVVATDNADAAKKVKLNKTKLNMEAGSVYKLKVKSGKKAAKVTWKSSKKSVAKVSKKTTKGNKAVTIKAVKKGKAVITATYKLKGATTKLKCSVKVSDAKVVPTVAPTAAPTAAPTVAPTAAPTATPTAVPTATPTPTANVVTAAEAVVEKNVPADYRDVKDGVDYGEFLRNEKYYSNITNSERTVNIVLPAGYDESQKYPVVYMMHGIGCNKDMFGTAADASSIVKIFANLRAQDKCKDMIIVFPEIRVATDGETDANRHTLENYKNYDNFREDLINNLMPFMEENFAVATGRENTAVCGWSMGGREALYIGLSRPDLFGFVGGYCPAFGLLPYTNSDVGRSEEGLLAVEGATEDIIKLPEEYQNNTYVQISFGTYDDVVKDEPTRYANALKAGDIPFVLTEYPSGHSDGVYDPGFYVFAMNAFKTVE